MTKLTRAQRASDAVAWFCGSWTFIIAFAIFTFVWVILNVMVWIYHWDPYPFILLNLVFTVVELFQGPVIMLSQNRQVDRDRETVLDLHTKLDELKQIIEQKK